ncbi:hypothetical protein GC169_01780 [bacterium]|nr:hypothetical protein [bacterium]
MNPDHLFHVSEQGGIGCFHPRPPPAPEVGPGHDCVWSIAYSHLPNYLSPRDCPRVIVRRGEATSEGDADRFLGGASCVMTIEGDWAGRMAATGIYVYPFEAGPHWRLQDAPSRNFVSARSIISVGCVFVPNPAAALAARDVELRFSDDLRSHADAVAASSIAFSIIRLRNARPAGA